jgi:hypothetical protein
VSRDATGGANLVDEGDEGKGPSPLQPRAVGDDVTTPEVVPRSSQMF